MNTKQSDTGDRGQTGSPTRGRAESEIVLADVLQDPTACSYLPSELASLQYRLIPTLSSAQYYEYLRRGWRRHGMVFFRPQCAACRQCRSLRVVVDGFRLSKSQRRCLARNQEVRCSLHRPDTSSDQITLFNRYHDAMHALKGWPHRAADIDEYARSFLAGQFDFAHEMRFWREERLVGVGLVDITPWGMSSVYFYHDPDWRPEAPGVYSMLRELLFARDQAIPHHYLGYWISACASMAYKSNYGPHELLQAYVEMDQEPSWALPEAG